MFPNGSGMFPSRNPMFPSQEQDGLAAYMSPQDQQSALQSLMSQAGSFVENLGLALDTPAAIGRGVLAGDPLSGFSWDSERRVSGIELNKFYGLDVEDPYLRAGAGFATEIITDPLFWLTGGSRALKAAGAAADATGLLKSAPQAYMAKYGIGAAEATGRGKLISGMFDANQVARTPGNYKAVSPVGQRVAQSRLTLEDLLQYAADRPAAEQALVNRLGSTQALDALRQQKLGGLLGINVGKHINYAISPPGTDFALDALDKLGAAVRFSYPGRLGTSISSKAVDGAVDFGEQVTSLRSNIIQEQALRAGREEATRHGLLLSKIALSPNSQSLLGADSLFSVPGNSMLTRLAEGKGNPNDLRVLADTPGLNDWLDNWNRIRTQQFADRKTFGLTGNKYSDKYGTEYTPRYGDEMDFESMGQGKGNALFNAGQTEAFGRRRSLMTPGGTDDLREISLLPEVIARSQPGATINEEATGNAILAWFRRTHPAEPIGIDQAKAIGRSLSRRRVDLPDGTPVFAAHPANSQQRRILSQAVSLGRASFVLEALSEASEAGVSAVRPGRWRNLQQSFDEIAGKTGFSTAGGNAAKSAANALKAKMAIQLNVDPRTIDLANFAVPERVVRRLEKIGDFYSTSQAQQELTGYLDGWTKLFKGFVLATPRRFVRDAYSNAVSIWLETGSGSRTLNGMTAANHITAGNFARAMPELRKIPEFAQLSDDAIREAFSVEVGTHNVLGGLQSSELLSTSRTGSVGQLVPGATPTSISAGIRQLIPDGSRSPVQMAQDFAEPFVDFAMNRKMRYQQSNPLLRASTEINDSIDSMGRMGGFIALRQQGISAPEAADRIRKALVDYQSLTLTERKWLRSIFPWYSYTSRIGAYALESMYNRPGGLYGQMIRGSNTLQQGDGDEYIPEQIRKQFAIRIPDAVAEFTGLAQPGVRTYIKDLDLPGIDVLNTINPGKTISDTVTGTLKNLGAQTSPPIQALTSMVTGRDLFSDRLLTESVTPQDRIYKALSGDPQGLSPLTKTLVGLVPGLQTPIGIGGALADDRIENPYRRAAKSALNYASGFKIQDIDEKFLLEDQQNQIADELRAKTRTMAKQFVPDELKPTLTPKELQLDQLSRWLERQSRILRDRKKQQQR